jgi:hypothetical protein
LQVTFCLLFLLALFVLHGSMDVAANLLSSNNLSFFYLFMLSTWSLCLYASSQSQWSRGQRYELSLPTGIVGSNPTQGMDVCMVCIYCVFVSSCV